MKSSTLAGKVILITGAAGGIGRSTAAHLIARGAVPVLADLDARGLKEAAAELSGNPLTVVVDVTDSASCDAAVETTIRHHGRIDVVWANAGISAFGPLDLMDSDVWRRVVEVNLLGSYNIVKSALPSIIEQRGYVALTASFASFAHSPGHSAYAASKAGVEAYANCLRSELASTGVQVGIFHPGWVDTALVTDKRDNQAAFRTLLASLPGPLRALTPVEDVARVLADAFSRRSAKVIFPRLGWVLHSLRALLPTNIVTARARKAAPEIRRLFAEQVHPHH
ncbi:short-chain dehydrogenase/reductase [Nocardia sp. NPDC058518]|uniref:short-chain dehydrogenase/reductase n=1 Tax=Nocardia sp. NPDC058518 TaxID=3346534 RepID=UPI003661E077